MLEAKALRKYVRSSPRKMKIVVDEVRGLRVGEALNKLHFMPQVAARTVEETVQSAVYNLVDKHKDDSVDEEAVFISEIFVTPAPMFKRIQPVSRGRAHRIHKRNSHLTVVVRAGSNDGNEES